MRYQLTFWHKILIFIGVALWMWWALGAQGNAETTGTKDVIRVIPPVEPKTVKLANDAGLDDGSIIDLAVFYSSSARTALGGDTQAQTFALNMVQNDNMVLANSQVAPRLRMVYAGLYPLAETGDGSTDLMQLQQNAEVANLRNQYGADCVQLLSKSTGGSCGISYIMDPAGSWFVGNAFSDVPYSCAIANFSSMHELGHNMGNDHDPADSTGGGAFSFSQGYQGAHQRDCMAYGSTVRVAAFSNGGRFQWNGAPLGDAVSDAARTIQLTSATVARFRQSVLSPVQTPTPAPSPTPTPTPQPGPVGVWGPSSITSGQQVTVTWKDPVAKSGKTTIFLFLGDTSGSKGKPSLGYVSVAVGTLTAPVPTVPKNVAFYLVEKSDQTGVKQFSAVGQTH